MLKHTLNLDENAELKLDSPCTCIKLHNINNLVSLKPEQYLTKDSRISGNYKFKTIQSN